MRTSYRRMSICQARMAVEAAPGEARQLHRDAQCGYVRVPLDRTKPDGKTIKVYFERYPRRNRELPRTSTVVSIEGGPGYPSRPAARRASICGVRSRASGISCSSTCEEPAGAHRSAARHSRASPAATWPAPAAVPPRSGRSETCIRPRKPCRTWRPCCARFTPARSASTATPTGRTPPRPTRSASRSDSLARARRGLPLAGNRPRLRRSRRSDPPGPRAFLLAVSRVPDKESGEAGRALRRPRARGAHSRLSPRRRRDAHEGPPERGRTRPARLWARPIPLAPVRSASGTSSRLSRARLTRPIPPAVLPATPRRATTGA
jgi:hypothetical protein